MTSQSHSHKWGEWAENGRATETTTQSARRKEKEIKIQQQRT